MFAAIHQILVVFFGIIVLCSIYGGNAQLSAKLISVSAMFSMITIPMWALFLN